ncbi:hypothetical protein SHIRM173S_10709 [Streptomyces hirsutus]
MVVYAYYVLIAGLIMVGVGRLGRWGEIWRRYGPPAWRRAPRAAERPPAPEDDPATWPALRAAGAADAADRLAADARAGLMRDVDHARISRAWQGVQSGRHPLATFTGTVLSHGAAACPHPSGARDLPARQARHDLLTGQVRLGTTADDARNPYAYRGTGLALGPELLGTSLVAVWTGRLRQDRRRRPAARRVAVPARARRTRRGGRRRRRRRGSGPGRRVRRRGTDRQPRLRVRPRPVRRDHRPRRGRRRPRRGAGR